MSREEFERLTIRTEVITHDLHQLTNLVADIAEDMTELRSDVNELRSDVNELRTDLNELRTEMNSRFDALGKVVADGHTAVLSAVLKLSPR